MPGTDTQVHDYNGGIAPNGLFWTVRIPDDALEVDGDEIRLCIDDLRVVDSFTFLGANEVPAKVSLDMTWRATSDAREIVPASSDPTDPGNFAGKFRFALAEGEFAAKGPDIRFKRAYATSEGLFAEFGKQRNGVFSSGGGGGGEGGDDDDDDDGDDDARSLPQR